MEVIDSWEIYESTKAKPKGGETVSRQTKDPLPAVPKGKRQSTPFTAKAIELQTFSDAAFATREVPAPAPAPAPALAPSLISARPLPASTFKHEPSNVQQRPLPLPPAPIFEADSHVAGTSFPAFSYPSAPALPPRMHVNDEMGADEPPSMLSSNQRNDQQSFYDVDRAPPVPTRLADPLTVPKQTPAIRALQAYTNQFVVFNALHRKSSYLSQNRILVLV
jgi:hypothetical protein